MEAKIFFARKDYAGTIRVLEEYREKHGAEGQHFEDPYVWQMMAESYYLLRGPDGKVRPADLLKAEQYYDVARSILYRGLEGQPREGAEGARTALERLYWRWVYRWLNFKYVIGTKLDKPTELRKILVFLDESARSDMAGYKQQFLKLKQAAESASKRASGRSR